MPKRSRERECARHTTRLSSLTHSWYNESDILFMILCLARPLCSTASQLVIALVCESLWWVPERVIEEESKQNKENWAAACKDLWLSSFRPARTQDSFRGSFHWNDSRAFKGFCAMSSRLWFPFISLNDCSDKEIRMIATDKNCFKH